MVLILNGEVLQDNDPRAIAARNSKAKPGAAPSARGPPAREVDSNAPAAAQQQQPGFPGLSMLDGLARAIGVHGKTVRVPAVLGVPGQDLPVIVFVLLGVATFFFGWMLLAVAALAYVALGSQGPANAAAPAPAAGGPPASKAGGGPPRGKPAGGVHSLLD
jgi:hypothetical protein